ncbi:unnamed protein product [Adineta ricciae]|uniref:MULE transposase domain-containing protein n=1 Tax=Adineta ricciae TaxID=249248 RepID=A0A813WW90_ADIRI|nr:unnamed protein product [Adineta ricciae]CAF1503040.1 unnamed protein product [Adineta ricciae]
MSEVSLYVDKPICSITGSKKLTYQELFQELNSIAVSLGIVWKPERIMPDFEVGLIPAISTKFPESIHSCCFFRYQHSLYRRIQSLGLAAAYSNDELVRNYCRKLMALALLPVDKVESSFYHLRTTVDSTVKKQLRGLFMYFDNYWINTIPVQMWNVRNCPYRTNNICEGFHSRLNRRIERAHMVLYPVYSGRGN